MKNVNVRAYILLAMSLLLTACATSNVNVQPNFWQNKPKKIALAMAPIPKAGLVKFGVQGILDYAISTAVTDSFQKHMRSYDLQELVSIKDDFIKAMQKEKLNVVLFKNTIDVHHLHKFKSYQSRYARLDYRPLQETIPANSLLLISIDQIGAIRKYYGFIPLGAPKAYLVLSGELINLETNELLWRHKVAIYEPISSPWDQPKLYPNYDRAMHAAIEKSKKEMLNSFFAK